MPIDEVVDPGLKAILNIDVDNEIKAMLVYHYCRIYKLNEGNPNNTTVSLEDYLRMCRKREEHKMFYLRDSESNLVPFKRYRGIVIPVFHRSKRK
jgi:hypothetical protein